MKFSASLADEESVQWNILLCIQLRRSHENQTVIWSILTGDKRLFPFFLQLTSFSPVPRLVFILSEFLSNSQYQFIVSILYESSSFTHFTFKRYELRNQQEIIETRKKMFITKRESSCLFLTTSTSNDTRSPYTLAQ